MDLDSYESEVDTVVETLYSTLKELESKLEEAIELVKGLESEDKVKAGILWNSYSAQLQLIINNTTETELLDSSIDDQEQVEEIGHSGPVPISGGISTSDDSNFLLIDQSSSNFSTNPTEVETDLETDNEPSSCGIDPDHLDLEFLNNKPNAELSRSGEGLLELSSLSSQNPKSSEVTLNDDVSKGTETPDNPALINLQSKVISEDANDSTTVEKEGSSPLKSEAPSAKQFKCNECESSFSTKGNLNVHKRKHSGDRPFACPKCTNRFTTSGNLRRHLLSHQGLKPYPCTSCDSRFTEKKSLLIHLRSHTGERPYECKICSKRYGQLSILQQHLATHTNAKPHLCHQCGRSFTQKSQLKLHERRHAGIKGHSCTQCKAAFTTKSDLLRHEKIHTGAKPFVCTIDKCGKAFVRSQYLKKHQTQQHKSS